MAELFDPVERLREIKKYSNYFVVEDEIYYQVLESDLDKLIAYAEAVGELHKPFGIYDECGHSHTELEADDPESGVLFIDEIGFTCKSGFMYYVCKECCLDGSEEQHVSEECGEHHLHEEGWTCDTAKCFELLKEVGK